VAKLLEYGSEVTVYDCNSAESPVRHDPRVNLVREDVRNYEKLDQATRGQDYVFHLAAALGVEKIVNIPLQVLEVNLGGTVNALRAAAENGVKRFLYTSSSEVYGQPRKVPIAEDDLTAPISTYGVSKLAGESYCAAFHKEHGLNYTTVRLFNIYGPWQTEKFVMPLFISRVMKKTPPIIYGNGQQSRSYTFITDAVNGILLAGASEDAIGEVFNIGNDEEISINELAEFIIEISGNNLKPIYKPFGNGIRVENREVLRRQPDISKARDLLGFAVHVSWQEGVRQFREWYLENHSE
jgi:UDP-glucose 4-epimerase